MAHNPPASIPLQSALIQMPVALALSPSATVQMPTQIMPLPLAGMSGSPGPMAPPSARYLPRQVLTVLRLVPVQNQPGQTVPPLVDSHWHRGPAARLLVLVIKRIKHAALR